MREQTAETEPEIETETQREHSKGSRQDSSKTYYIRGIAVGELDTIQETVELESAFYYLS